MKVTEDDLYRILSYNDKEILSHFEDNSYTDKEYLFAALNSDIFSSTLDLINNLKIGNTKSPGVDTDCRKIIEAYTLLKMCMSGNISEKQLSFFRKQYLLVEYFNYESYIKQTKGNPIIDKLVEKKKSYVDELCKFYNVKERQLRDFYYEDPLFFLKKSVDEKITFNLLIKKYNVFGEDKLPMYEFFSIMSHPHYIENEELEKQTFEIRDLFIKHIFDLVFKYTIDLKLWVDNCKEKTFSELMNQECLKSNLIEIASFDVFFDKVMEKTKPLQGTDDRYAVYFWTTLKSLVKDMLVAETLGYNEQCVAKFKCFAEFAGVDFLINISESAFEFKSLKYAYYLSSKIAISECLGKTIKHHENFDEELKILFDAYYKDKYSLNDFKIFKSKFCSNSLYFVSKFPKSYKKPVKQMVSEIFPTDFYKNEFMTMLACSNDYAHAGGYTFNSSPGVTEEAPHRVMAVVAEYLIIHLLNIVAVAEDHKIEVDFKEEIGFLRFIKNGEEETTLNIEKKYKDIVEKN